MHAYYKYIQIKVKLNLENCAKEANAEILHIQPFLHIVVDAHIRSICRMMSTKSRSVCLLARLPARFFAAFAAALIE